MQARSPAVRLRDGLRPGGWASLVGTATELELEPLEAATGTAKFDLTLFAAERDGGLKLALEYSAELAAGDPFKDKDDIPAEKKAIAAEWLTTVLADGERRVEVPFEFIAPPGG